MGMQTLIVQIDGVSPLMMKNGQTADPLNKWSKAMKAVTSKRKKTDDDYAELSRIEWLSALYVDNQERLVMPSEVLDACIYDGAKKSKLGKAFKSAVFVDDTTPIQFTIDTRYSKASDLWDIGSDGNKTYVDVRGVRVGQARVMRTRPIFRKWQITFTVYFDDEQVNESEVLTALHDAGSKCGLCDNRPKFGRFTLSVVNGVSTDEVGSGRKGKKNKAETVES